ncbi:hypothetical protein GCM10009122_56500 [Fulvivirga kasyanovii]|uniref:amino acid adenylation domain-containing protein n=1 Tax=Fulvivirga kasyanovii TaxID=396812 RepID=UPI0031DF0D45
MNISKFIFLLEELKVKVRLVDGQLELNAPKGALTQSLVNQIKERKPEIIQFLEKAKQVASFSSIPKAEDNEFYDLSHAQKRLWILNQAYGEQANFNIPISYLFKGKLNREVFHKAIESVIGRHESLRTSFVVVDGEPYQHIQPANTSTFRFVYVDLRNDENIEAKAMELVSKEYAYPFDLSTDSLIRAKLLQLENEKFVFVLVKHHIISDGWSTGILMQEIVDLYNAYLQGKPNPLSPLQIQYKDYAVWQNNLLKEDGGNRDRKYWLDQFSNMEIPHLDLTHRTRPAEMTYNGAEETHRFDTTILRDIKSFNQKHETTLFMTLLAVTNILFYRYTDQENIIIGTPVAGRNHPDLENQVGFYINTLPLKVNISSADSFEDVLKKVKKTTLGGYEHQSYPFDKLLEDLNLHRDMSRSPLFDVMLVLQNIDLAGNAIMEGVKVESYHVDKNLSKYDLTIGFSEWDGNLLTEFSYNKDLFSADFIRQMLFHFKAILKAVLDKPHIPIVEIDYLSEDEKNAIIKPRKQPSVSSPKLIHQIFEAQASATPDAIAIDFDGKYLTYKELNEEANKVAHYLKATCDLKKDSLVGLMVERSEKMVIGVFGILKAGAAYVPIDPSYPETRINYILNDTNLSTVLTDHVGAGKKFEREDIRCISLNDEKLDSFSSNNLDLEITPESLSYIIYTSGSTGNPKGVMVEHRHVVQLLEKDNVPIPFGTEDIWTLFHSICFDVSVWEVFGALLYGGKLMVIPKDIARDPSLFVDLLVDKQVSVLNQTPSMFNTIIAEVLSRKEKPQLSLKCVICAGEAFSPASIDQWYRQYPEVAMINMYGITETTVHSSFKYITEDEIRIGESNVGVALPNVQLYIMDGRQQLKPFGCTGEIVVGGRGVTRGYLNLPELTAGRFVPDPFNKGQYLYLSGDLGVMLSSGDIIYQGRRDNQVKVRGFRIEIAEIEKTMLSHPDIAQATVVLKENGDSKDLLAYYTGKTHIKGTQLRAYLVQKIPEYMVPSSFIYTPAFPLTHNGKIDKKALLQITGENDEDRASRMPQSQVDKDIAHIWEDVLGKSSVSLDDNFFTIGGDSLKATKIISRAHKELGAKINLSDIFKNPTIGQLGAHIKKLQVQHYSRIEPLPVQNQYEASHAQHRLWLLNELNHTPTAYNIHGSFHLKGDLELDIFRKAIRALVERHESLRTGFIYEDDQLYQQVLPYDENKVNYEYNDLTAEATPSEAAKAIVEGEKYISFDLAAGNLYSVKLLKIAASEFIYTFTLHHVIADNWSLNILADELVVLYNSFYNQVSNPLKPLQVQYKDYAAWQNKQLSLEVFNDHEQYWLRQFEAGVPVLNLPYDKPRPANKTFNGATVQCVIDPRLTQGIKNVCKESATTVYMYLLTAVNVLLHKYSGQNKIVVGTSVSGRESLELEDQVGLFINQLALYSHISVDATWLETLEGIKKVVLDGHRHKIYPLNLLVDKLGVKRDPSRSPMFDVMVDMLEAGGKAGEGTMQGVQIEGLEDRVNASKFDLTIGFTEIEGGITGTFEYNTDLFKATSVQILVQRFLKLLEQTISNPSVRIDQIDTKLQIEEDLGGVLIEAEFDF